VTTWAIAVAQLRHLTGLTQEQLARELGVTVSSVNRWENGHALPIPLARIALRSLAQQWEVRDLQWPA